MSSTSSTSTGSAANDTYCQDGPSLGGFTVFALDAGTKQTVLFSKDTINRPVGIAGGAGVTDNSNSTLNGNVYVDKAGTFSPSRFAPINGSVFYNQSLSSLRSTAISDSSTAAADTPEHTHASITSPTTITGHAGLNVIKIGSINLSNGALVLSGPANAFFVLNVSGSITLRSRRGAGRSG